MFKPNELRSVIAKKGESQKSLAAAIGMQASELSVKINGKRDFNIKEMNAIRKRYGLTAEQMMQIFFAD